MDFFSSLVDFDIFRLVSVDCIAPITHLNKVVGFVLLPIVALLFLFTLFHLGRMARLRLLKNHLRIVDGKATGTSEYPPRTIQQQEEMSRREQRMKEEEERKRKEREAAKMKITKKEQCSLLCSKCIYAVVKKMRASMHLEHAIIGNPHKDATLPSSIGEIRTNITNWKRRVAIQVQMGFFLNKIIRLFFWILLLAYVPVSSTIMRYYLCEPIGDKFYLVADLRVVCYSQGKGYVIYTDAVERLEETTANIFKPKLSQQLLNNCYN